MVYAVRLARDERLSCMPSTEQSDTPESVLNARYGGQWRSLHLLSASDGFSVWQNFPHALFFPYDEISEILDTGLYVWIDSHPDKLFLLQRREA